MIQNEEDVRELTGKVNMINHVHISEPRLRPVKKRELHIELKTVLETENYNCFRNNINGFHLHYAFY